MKIIGNGGHAKVVRALIEAQRVIYPPNYLIIAVGDNHDRRKEALQVSPEYIVARLIHPSAVIEPSVNIGAGTVIMAGVIVQSDVVIGKHVILNTGCTVDHDCVIEDYAHIAPGVHLCGGVHVGEGALVGVGACAVPNAKIPAWSLVKAGTVAK